MNPTPHHDPIGLALSEDIGSGDMTSQYFISESEQRAAQIIAKEAGVAAGVEVAAEVFARIDPKLSVVALTPSGMPVRPGDVVLEIYGLVRSILTAERVALNFLQRLSGVATLTSRYVEAVAGTNAKILDTRKTTPCLRAFEKAAVRAGGGTNHRFGLFDMVMVKDNHLVSQAISLKEAIQRFRAEHPGMKVELEADTLDQVREFVELGTVDVILLDNMSLSQMSEAVGIADGRVLLEASGGVTLKSVRAIAETGVDYISVGALTHSAAALDFSLELI